MKKHTEWIDLIYKRRQLAPVVAPKDAAPRLRRLKGIKAVVFDVYGTLFSSGVGDISLATEQNRDEIIKETLSNNGYIVTEDGCNIRIDHELYTQISLHQKKRRVEGINYPEVEIRAVWKDFLAELEEHGFMSSIESPTPIETLIIDYESRVNPTQGIPGLSETLAQIKEAGLKLSIISNAQFYTPLLFETHLGKDLSSLGFEKDCSVWSFAELEGKPSQGLYKLSATKLKESYGIDPEQILYVGNDIRNDIWPAQAIGFRTALFAGDHLSLRLRRSDPNCAGVIADIQITDLRQIAECIGI